MTNKKEPQLIRTNRVPRERWALSSRMSERIDIDWFRREMVRAYFEARKHKTNTRDERQFELNWATNLEILIQDILAGTYRPSRGVAFVIKKPVIREIFAAPFRDRVVHHFIYNMVYGWWDKRFIDNSFSCRPGKGTLCGVQTLYRDIREVSKGGRRKAYVIKMDISGYFMSLSREKLYRRAIWGLKQQYPNGGPIFCLIRFLWGEIIFDDPVHGVKKRRPLSNWDILPNNKSLMHQPFGRGIVIGNLTSQLLSNIYLDLLDRFVTIQLGYKHYGRYVDDFYLVVSEAELEQAKRDIKLIERFLLDIGLMMHPKKTRIQEVRKGVEFLGAMIFPFNITPGKRVRKNMHKALYEVAEGSKSVATVVSYIGHSAHLKSYKVCESAFDKVGLPYFAGEWGGGIMNFEQSLKRLKYRA